MTMYFKVWVGYDHPIRITDKDYMGALEAHVTGKIIVINGISISGRSIILIEPDYHRALGWNDNYRIGSHEDRKQIQRECPGYEEFMTLASNALRERIPRGELVKRNELPAPLAETESLSNHMRIK